MKITEKARIIVTNEKLQEILSQYYHIDFDAVCLLTVTYDDGSEEYAVEARKNYKTGENMTHWSE